MAMYVNTPLHLLYCATLPRPLELRHTEMCNKLISSTFGANHPQIHLDRQYRSKSVEKTHTVFHSKPTQNNEMNRKLSIASVNEGKEY